VLGGVGLIAAAGIAGLSYERIGRMHFDGIPEERPA
jgi:hypothetical protein